jgi:hydroxyacyl-ACP dehydratase HTD2-like protein with hotdog domain
MQLPELIKNPTHSMLFRFSAVTWNTHRIHYDQQYAQFEQHPDVLVQATMHGAFLLEMLKIFVKDSGEIKVFEYSNRGRAIPGDTLICRAVVTEVNIAARDFICAIEEVNQHGQVCASGTAKIVLKN